MKVIILSQLAPLAAQRPFLREQRNTPRRRNRNGENVTGLKNTQRAQSAHKARAHKNAFFQKSQPVKHSLFVLPFQPRMRAEKQFCQMTHLYARLIKYGVYEKCIVFKNLFDTSCVFLMFDIFLAYSGTFKILFKKLAA